jgi:predicted peroxiredoxin
MVHEEVSMAKFLFVLATGTENPARGTRCLHLASVALEDGHEVNVFLLDDAVTFARKGAAENIVAPTGDDMEQHLRKLIEAHVPFYVCTPCAKARHVNEEDLFEGARLTTAKTLIALAAESKVFNF